MAYAKQTWVDGSSGGTPISAARLNNMEDGIETADKFGVPLFARKTATESVTSSTVLQDDDHLSLSVVANAVYELTMGLFMDGVAAGDFKGDFVVPASATVDVVAIHVFITGAGQDNPVVVYENVGSLIRAGCIGAGTTLGCLVHGLAIIAATAGTLKLQWAQDASNATATRLFAPSFLCLRRVA